MNKKQINKHNHKYKINYKNTNYKSNQTNQSNQSNQSKYTMNGKGLNKQINIIQFTDIPNIQSELAAQFYPELDNYKNKKGLIYFSIGSKINEPTLAYKSFRNEDLSLMTNSQYQLVPSFLYADSIQRETLLCNENVCDSLCVILDSFSPDELKYNLSIIQHYFRINNASNIKLYILNTYEIRTTNNVLFTEKIIRNMCDELILRNIPSEQFMLCNYVKFKSHIEYSYEQSIKNILESVLREKNYENSHYEWFGYRMSGNYVLYDFIYLNKQFTENDVLQFVMFIMNLVKTAYITEKIERNIQVNQQIHALSEDDYKSISNITKFEVNKEKMKYVYQITRMTKFGDLGIVNNLFTYSLYNSI